MNLKPRCLTGTSLLLTLAALSGSAASAQCGGPAKIAFSSLGLRPGAHIALTGWSEKGDDRWGDERDENGQEPIVGLWHVDMEDPSKGYIDKGYMAWHSDHTEFFNSTRAPGTGAVCQGVWEKVGRSTYQLNHYALAYNGTVAANKEGSVSPDETAPSQIVHIREIVTVGPARKHFHGQFLVEVYSYVGHTLLVSFSGPVTADRITIDTPISSQ